MFKFFRRGKSDKSDQDGQDPKKRSLSKENVKKSNVSSTLENSWRSRGKQPLSASPLESARATATIGKNKVVDDRQDNRHNHPLKIENNGPGAKTKHLKKWSALPLAVFASKDDDQSVENAKSGHAREISSRNEIVDPTRSDRTTSCRNQNDRSRFEIIDKNNASTSATHEDNQVYLVHSQNQCPEKQQKQHQQLHRPPSNRFDQAPNAHATAFNPINKSREFFYEIMGKNRSRNRNRNRNKDTKPYNRVLIIDNQSVAENDADIIDTDDKQNISNDIVQRKQKPPTQELPLSLECDVMSNSPEDYNSAGDKNSGEVNSDADDDDDRNQPSDCIDEFPRESQNEYDENFKNFGYQITKSKNRTNLVIKCKGEYQTDRGKTSEAKYLHDECLQECDGDRVERMEAAEAHDSGRTSQCADASCDANGSECENSLFGGNEGSPQSRHNCDNNNSITGIGAAETHHETISTATVELDSKRRSEEASPEQPDSFNNKEPRHIELHNAGASAPLDQDTGVVDEEWHSQKNLIDTRNRIDGQLELDRHDLEDERLSITSQSKQSIECGFHQLRQGLAESENMGQDNSKRASDQHKRSRSDHVQSKVVIPTITVADYSETSSKDLNKVNVSIKKSDEILADADVFYDTETFEADSAENASGTSAVTFEKDNNVVFDDRVVIEDDSEDETCAGDGYSHFADIPATVIDASDPQLHQLNACETIHHSGTGENINLSNNSSSSTISNDSKHNDSPDSGIEILDDSRNNPSSESTEHFLHINRSGEPFIRGGSTDCDENFLLQSDNEDPDYTYHHHTRPKRLDSISKNEKPIFIDSISLPDVVVESTNIAPGMGNSHSVKTVEHLEDHHHHRPTTVATDHNDNETRDLVNQEARYSAQLEEAQQIIIETQTKVNELQSKIDSLEKDLSIKSWNVDRLQGELQAANKEDACIRRRINLLQSELVDVKQKYSDDEYELNRRYDELKTKHHELLDNYRHTQNLANALQTQLTFLQSEIDRSRQEKEKLCEEKDEQVKNLQIALQQSQEKHKELETKWQTEFEVLRTQNADREEHLMVDCEWKLRTMQRNCKDKLEAAKREKNEALEKANEISSRATEELEHVAHLLPLEAEIKQLRGLTNEQTESLVSMSEQMCELRSDLEAANAQLEVEIENVRKIRLHCDNALSDKDRQMIQKIEEARGQVAVEWERRLLEEMTRLKHEVELVNVEERHDALEKLQQEHIEEIKVLTCRYDANEEELRTEIGKLREALQQKCDEFNKLKEKTDAALWETRLHLERADAEYQVAVNREIEKREMLEAHLKAEFHEEKCEMEEKFRERLNQIKDEFARELANTTEDMSQKHRKQLGKQPLAYGKKHLSKMGSSSLQSEQQWEKLVAEKEEALHSMESRHRIRLEEAGNRIKELEIQHHREMKEIKTNFEIERTTLETRDLQNSQEIEQLHRKCRCLTNLFEEMRMRYERREPRPEDLREIAELRERCESQERDLHALTERLREIQIEKEENENAMSVQRKSKTTLRKPPPKTIPTNCDVIYEENEERESPHKESCGIITDIVGDDDEEENSEYDDEELSENIRNDIDKKSHDTSFIAVESLS